MNPERVRHSDDYIDQAGDGFRWRSIVLGIIVIAMLGLLLYFPSRQSGKASIERRSEISSGPLARGPMPSAPR